MPRLELDLRVKVKLDLLFHEYLIGLNSFPFTVWVGVKHSLLLKLSVVLGVLIYFLNFLTKDHFNSSEHTLSHFFRWLCFLFEFFFFLIFMKPENISPSSSTLLNMTLRLCRIHSSMIWGFWSVGDYSSKNVSYF